MRRSAHIFCFLSEIEADECVGHVGDCVFRRLVSFYQGSVCLFFLDIRFWDSSRVVD